MEVLTLKKISPKELDERMQGEEKVLLLDVRAEEKYNEYHIEDSQVLCLNIQKTVIFNLEEGDKLAQISKEQPIIITKEQPIVVTCTTGNSATKCADILDGLGYQVEVLEGGLTAWNEYRK